MKKRIICLLCLLAVFIFPVQEISARDYSNYSTTFAAWGPVNNPEHQTPRVGYPYEGFRLEDYNAFYVGNTREKIVYLTFDCGYENGNTGAILDTLKKYDVKAVFFVTGQFVKTSPDLIRRMKREGHLVGNHTSSHINMATSSVDEIVSQIRSLEKTMKETTGYSMDKFVRPPCGEYNERALKVLQDMGYHTVFWSLAWYDYDVNNQPSVASVVQKFVSYHHKGMIPLMHNTSTADTRALPRIIKYLKSQGYAFERIDDATRKTSIIKMKAARHIYNGKSPKIKVRSNSDAKINCTYYDSAHKKIKMPVHAGTYFVKAVVKATANYKYAEEELKFRIQKAETKIELEPISDIYEGEEYEIKADVNHKGGERTYTYYDSDGTKIEKPTAAGSYYVKVKVAATRDYKKAVSEKVPFEILEGGSIIVP